MTENKSYQLLNKNKTMKWFFLGLFAFIIIFLLYIFRVYLWVFVFSMIFYVALKPLFEKMHNRLRNRALSATVVMILLFVLVLTPSMVLMFSLSEQVIELYKHVQVRVESGFLEHFEGNEYVDRVLEFLDIDKGEITEKFVGFTKRTSLNIFTALTSVISYPINFIIKFLLMVLIIFFLLKDGYRADGAIYKILPFPDDIERDMILKLKDVIYVLILGNIIIMAVQGFMVGCGLYIAGIRMPLLWGTVAAVLSLIPVVGTTFIWGPVALYFILIGKYEWAVFISVWCFSWYMLLENLVKPKIFGDKLNFHPLIFFFLLLGSIQAFGLPGIIIGPILLSLFYSFWEIYKALDTYDLDNKIKDEERKILPPQDIS